jgi:hypothetical protein
VRSRPLELTWAPDPFRGDESRFTLAGGGLGRASGNGFRLSVHLAEIPVGTQYDVGGVRGVVTADTASREVWVDVLPKLAAVRWADRDRVDLGISMKLALPDGRTGEATIPPLSFESSWLVLGSTGQKGVVFGDEPIEAYRPDGLIYASDHGVRFFGSARTFAEIDFLATDGPSGIETGRKTCRGYQNERGNRVADITLVLRGRDVNVLDRRTGQVVHTRSFPPDTSCPMVGLATGDQREVISGVSSAAVERWLKALVKR